jgi:hypothetical protein
MSRCQADPSGPADHGQARPTGVGEMDALGTCWLARPGSPRSPMKL